MRRVTRRGSVEARARAVAFVLAFFASASVSACTGSGPGSSSGCPAETSFQVFEPASSTSAIPLCTDATSAASVQIKGLDGAVGYLFPGAPPLSSAGLEQCAAICSTAPSPVPCCQSPWLARTIVCSTATPGCP